MSQQYMGREVPTYEEPADVPAAFKTYAASGPVPRFASATLRDAVFTGAPAPKGMLVYRADAGLYETWTGSRWDKLLTEPETGHGTFLPLSGGTVTGELGLRKNLDVAGNVTATLFQTSKRDPYARFYSLTDGNSVVTNIYAKGAWRGDVWKFWETAPEDDWTTTLEGHRPNRVGLAMNRLMTFNDGRVLVDNSKRAARSDGTGGHVTQSLRNIRVTSSNPDTAEKYGKDGDIWIQLE